MTEKETPVTDTTTEPAPKAAKAKADAGGLIVNVNANLSLQHGQILVVGEEGVAVPDTAEVRGCIAAGLIEEVEARSGKKS